MKHIPGTYNVLADHLSRLLVEKFRRLHHTADHLPTPISSNVAPLIPDLTRFLHASLAPSTTSTYRSAWTSYNTFCLSVGALPYPCQQILLLFYVTYLARRVSYSTIKVYLAAIQFHSY